jgi:hypothetical protein
MCVTDKFVIQLKVLRITFFKLWSRQYSTENTYTYIRTHLILHVKYQVDCEFNFVIIDFEKQVL